MKKTAETIFKRDEFPFLILVLCIFIHHCFIQGYIRDDIFYSQILNEHTFFGYLGQVWNSWTSRIAIEAAAVLLCRLPMIIWKVLDALIYGLLGWGIAEIFFVKNKRNCSWVLVCFMLLYSYSDMATAGWIVTTVTYLWPLSLGVLSLIPVKKIFCGEKVYWFEYLISFGALVFAVSLEQMNVVLLAVYGAALIYAVINKHPWFFMLIQTAASAVYLVLMFLCPGNGKRETMEIRQSFPAFRMMTFIDKVELGFSSTFYHYIIEKDVLFFILAVILMAGVWLQYKNRLYRMIALLPVVLCTVFFGIELFAGSFPGLSVIAEQLGSYGTIDLVNFDWRRSYLSIFILGITGCFVLLSIYLIYGNTKKMWILNGLLLLGLATRMAIGFSPTVWSSNARTYLIFSFAIIICCVNLLHDSVDRLKGKTTEYLFWGLSAGAAVSYLAGLASIL